MKTAHNLMKYIKNKKIYVLSPHFDDAILSMGSFLTLLAKISEVTVINLFTKAHNGPYTLASKKYLHSCGFNNAISLYAKRDEEDAAALHALKIKRINSPFSDALFRRKQRSIMGTFLPELDHVYPTYTFHIIRSVSKNDYCINLLEKYLLDTITSSFVIFAPVGIGNHTDHVITNQIARKLFPSCIFYEDFPYNKTSKKKLHLLKGYEKFSFPIDFKRKKQLINYYNSQMYSLFKNNDVPDHKEFFFVPELL